MQQMSDATQQDATAGPAASTAWRRAEALVQSVAVAAVAVAAVLAAVMQTRSDTEHSIRPACSECGVVDKAAPLANASPQPADQGRIAAQ